MSVEVIALIRQGGCVTKKHTIKKTPFDPQFESFSFPNDGSFPNDVSLPNGVSLPNYRPLPTPRPQAEPPHHLDEQGTVEEPPTGAASRSVSVSGSVFATS